MSIDAINEVFAEFGRPWIWRPTEGDEIGVTAIVRSEDRISTPFETEIRRVGAVIEVRVSEVPVPRREDRFERLVDPEDPEGEREAFRVKGEPMRLDPDRHIWTVDLAAVT